MPAMLPPIVEAEVPTWKSPNELIHERINFDDTIWGFGLAGGAYYNTPLRITYVRPGSRAEKAHILPGDVVTKINGIESKMVTLEEAHQMIIESGIHLKLNVTSPDDETDSYHCYVDPLEQAAEEELKAKAEKAKKKPPPPRVTGKCSQWGLQWPWVSKRKIIYKESNCYLVPSKYEEKHKDTRKPVVNQDDVIVLDSIHSAKKNVRNKTPTNTVEQEQHKEEAPENTVDTVQNDSDRKNNVDDIKEQNETLSTSEENSATESSKLVEENSKETEQISSIDKTEQDNAMEQNSSVNENDANMAEQDNSENKHEENDVVEHHSSSDVVVENNVEEENTSMDKNNENSVTQANNPAENNDEAAVENSIVDETKSQDAIVANDLDNNKTNDESVKFENGDIPDMNESENSR